MKHSLQMSETLRLGSSSPYPADLWTPTLILNGETYSQTPNRKSAPIRCKSRGRELFCHAQLSPPCSRVYSRHLTCRYCALPQHTTPLASAFRSVGSCYFNMCSLFPSLFKSPRKLTHLFCLRHSGRKLSQDPQQRSGYNYVYRKLKKRNRESAPLSANP